MPNSGNMLNTDLMLYFIMLVHPIQVLYHGEILRALTIVHLNIEFNLKISLFLNHAQQWQHAGPDIYLPALIPYSGQFDLQLT